MPAGQPDTLSGMEDTVDLRNMARETAELALRLARMSSGGPLRDPQALADIEQLASRILAEAQRVRGSGRSIGETSGIWPVVQPLRR